jgi:hypothetical protein
MMNYQNVFRKYPSIVSAYLFGSRSRGQTGPLSDFDFGIQIAEKFPASEYLNIKLKLTVDLVHATGSNAVDVVILNEAPLLLKYQIIRGGKLIYDRNPAKRALLTFDTISKYLDWNYYEKSLAKSLIKRTAAGGIGD